MLGVEAACVGEGEFSGTQCCPVLISFRWPLQGQPLVLKLHTQHGLEGPWLSPEEQP